ncbi:MAG: hypothetical protein PQJ60_06430 [Spirochaetales bacterium]|nr:hypothetical protein [Spirochaetales bacterium]
MVFELASKEDIPEVLKIHGKCHIDSVSDEDREDGFVTTLLDEALFLELIEKERGLVVAREQGRVVGFVMSASWEYCSKWPMFRHLIGMLGDIEFEGQRLSTENSYEYGPVCIDKEFRGAGVLQGLFECARKEMEKRYPFMLTFISPKNPRSLRAHRDKLKLESVLDFEYGGKDYIALAYDTSRPLA